MKTIKKEETYYICEKCGSQFQDKENAELCEKSCKCQHEEFEYADSWENYMSKYCINCDKHFDSIYYEEISQDLLEKIYNLIKDNENKK